LKEAENNIEELKQELSGKTGKIEKMHTEEEFAELNGKFIKQRDLLARAATQIKELTTNVNRHNEEAASAKKVIAELRQELDQIGHEKEQILVEVQKYKTFEESSKYFEKKFKETLVELENEKSDHATDIMALSEMRTRDDIIKLLQVQQYHDLSDKPEKITEEQEKRLKHIEGQIIKLSHLQKDLELKEENLKKKSRTFFRETKGAY